MEESLVRLRLAGYKEVGLEQTVLREECTN